MVKIARIILTVIVSLTTLVDARQSVSLPFAPRPLTKSDATINKILPTFEKKVNQIMKASGVPGAAIAVVSRDKVYYIKTFGVKKVGKQERITSTTLFQVASLSKPINATMVGILHDKRKLSVHDPIHRFLPHFKSHNPRQPVKICHLMSHSTGITNHGFNEMIEAFMPREAIVAKLQKRSPVASPGKQFVYHNAMYGMVEDVITKASGKSLERTLKEELFNPLGMRHASVGYQALLDAPNRAHPHVPNHRGRYVPATNYSKAYYSFKAAGGVNASILDMVPFLQLYLGKPSPVITNETLKLLTDPYVKNANAVLQHEVKKGRINNTFYGLGWHSMKYAQRKVIYHQGHLKGFRNFMGFLENDIGIIILTNAERKHASKIALSFFDLYLSA